MEEHRDEAFDEADIASLAEKLAALDLNAREQAALRELVADEVAGFAGGLDVGGLLGSRLTSLRAQGVPVFGLRDGAWTIGAKSDPGTGGPRRL
ncbi:MAG: hypothetical protein ACE367_25545 [Acidimicrobiales bacterium]